MHIKKGTQLYHMCVYDINGKARNNMYDVIYYCNKIGDLKAQTMKSYNITSSYTLLLFVHLNIELWKNDTVTFQVCYVHLCIVSRHYQLGYVRAIVNTLGMLKGMV